MSLAEDLSYDALDVRAPITRTWVDLRASAQQWAVREPLVTDLVHRVVLEASDFKTALARLIAFKLADREAQQHTLVTAVVEAISADPSIELGTLADLEGHYDRNPACPDRLTAFLFFKGFAATESHRVAHWMWNNQRQTGALFFQSRVSEVFDVDIHPAVPVGHGVFIDHGSGIVIGETARIGNNVSILQGVTLGGTGKEAGDRHPKIGNGVLLSAHAQVLGNVKIGDCAKIGAGSVVLTDIPPNSTAVGVPAPDYSQQQPVRPRRRHGSKPRLRITRDPRQIQSLLIGFSLRAPNSDPTLRRPSGNEFSNCQGLVFQ